MKFTKIISLVGIILLIIISCTTKQHLNTKIIPKVENPSKLMLGVDVLLNDSLHLVKNQRIGLITNPSGVNGDLQYTSDLFFFNSNINLVALFGPEHGVRGDAYAGDSVKTLIDEKTNIPVYSIYGKHKKPTAEMLQSVDILVFDIQDIGVRSYTYIYTLANAMQEAAKFDKTFIVLDRPNPLGGLLSEGNILDTTFASFVGMYPLPYIHGMTIGELAQYFNNEFHINCDLKIVPMKNWNRNFTYDQTGLAWAPTSPHVPEPSSVAYLATTGIIGELHTISIGVGYTTPFKLIGAPWIDGQKLADSLNKLNLTGVYFRPVYFKPFYSIFKNEKCSGVQIHITNSTAFKPYTTGLYILKEIIRLYPDQNIFAKKNRVKMFNQVVGTDKIKMDLENKVPINTIEASWQHGLDQFRAKREKYLLY